MDWFHRQPGFSLQLPFHFWLFWGQWHAFLRKMNYKSDHNNPGLDATFFATQRYTDWVTCLRSILWIRTEIFSQMSTGTANFLSGGLGSFAFWFAAIPADNIKKSDLTSRHPDSWLKRSLSSRMMASSLTGPRPTFRGTVRSIYATVGLRGFFAGLTPCLLRAFPSNACAFYVYEGLMRVFGAEKVGIYRSHNFSSLTFCAHRHGIDAK